MLRTILQNLVTIQAKHLVCSRNLTSTEVSAALRPFYFSVHPDLFGQYPSQRVNAINENSLQQLSAIIENLQASRPIKPIQLQFYIRDKVQNAEVTKVTFRLITIYLNGRDIRTVVINILKSCDLPTDYVDKIAVAQSSGSSQNIKFKMRDIDLTNINKNHPIYAQTIFQRNIKEAQESLKLRYWLKKNYQDALARSETYKPFKEEVERLCKMISQQLGLIEIRWDCGWNATHFRGCLLSFKALIEHHPDPMSILRGRRLVFSNFTGVSLEGDIMLYTGEVRHNWLDLIKHIKQYDGSLDRIPAFEKSLSHVLRNIKVGRRKFMPKIVAEDYENNLKQITTSLSDYRVKKPYPKQWPESLHNYEIVVETEAGPLMVSPTGQFIVPSTLPGALLVSFITTNLEEANQKMENYKRDKHVERLLHKNVIDELQLAALHKDDNVTPDLMIKCCEQLLNNKQELIPFIKSIHLNIATYYSVQTDGVVCIPWNWDL